MSACVQKGSKYMLIYGVYENGFERKVIFVGKVFQFIEKEIYLK